MPSIFHKVARSWRLIKASTAVLNSDGELLVLPVLSGAISLALGGGMVALAMSDGTFEALRNGQSLDALNSFYIWLFAFYLVQYFVIVFFNTALVGAALERLDGGDPTIRSSLALATRRLPQVLGYAIVSATVGVLLRMLAERFGLIGKIIGAGAAIAWAVTTFLVVPVIAAEGRGPLGVIERSTELHESCPDFWAVSRAGPDPEVKVTCRPGHVMHAQSVCADDQELNPVFFEQ